MSEAAPLPQATTLLPLRKESFNRMILASLLLHGLFALAMLSPRGGSSAAPAVTFIDLAMTAAPAPAMPVPAPRSEPPPVPAPAAPDETAAPRPEPAPPATAYDKLQADIQQARETATATPAAVRSVSFGIGMASGYFNSLADGKTLRPEVRDYYFTLLQQINEAWWRETGDRDIMNGGAVVNLFIDRSGKLLRIDLLKSSGTPAGDRAITRLMEKAGPFPAPPETVRGYIFEAPLRFVPPLTLMETVRTAIGR